MNTRSDGEFFFRVVLMVETGVKFIGSTLQETNILIFITYPNPIWQKERNSSKVPEIRGYYNLRYFDIWTWSPTKKLQFGSWCHPPSPRKVFEVGCFWMSEEIKSPRLGRIQKWNQKIISWQFCSVAIFEMIEWHFGKVVGDLQLGNKKVTAWITWFIFSGLEKVTIVVTWNCRYFENKKHPGGNFPIKWRP